MLREFLGRGFKPFSESSVHLYLENDTIKLINTPTHVWNPDKQEGVTYMLMIKHLFPRISENEMSKKGFLGQGVGGRDNSF